MARARCKRKDQDGWENLSAEDQAATKAMAMNRVMERRNIFGIDTDFRLAGFMDTEAKDAFRDMVEDIRDEDPGLDDEGYSNEENYTDFHDIVVGEDEVALDFPANVLDADSAVQTFRDRLRTIIQGLKDLAHNTRYNGAHVKSTYPLSYSFCFLLRQVSTDDFMAAYIAVIPK